MKAILKANSLLAACTLFLLAGSTSTLWSAQSAPTFGRDAGIRAIRASVASHSHSTSEHATRTTITAQHFGRDAGIQRIKNSSKPALIKKHVHYKKHFYGRDACIRALKNRGKKSKSVVLIGN